MIRKAKAIWNGLGTRGKGLISVPSGSLNGFSHKKIKLTHPVLATSQGSADSTPFSFQSRFEDKNPKESTNPEELLAAAHAGCFCHNLSLELEKEGFSPEKLDSSAEITIKDIENGYEITQIRLYMTGKVPNCHQDKFIELAEKAKNQCPISKALRAIPISLEVNFI